MVSERTARRRRSVRAQATNILAQPNAASYTRQSVPGNYPWGGVNYEELIKISPVSYDELQMMVDLDGHARGLFNLLRRPILRYAKHMVLDWDQTKGDAEGEFIHSVLLGPRHLGGMKTPITKVVGQICNAFLFGMAPFEKQFERPGTIVDDGLIRLESINYADPKTVTMLVDQKGEFTGFRQRANWRGEFINRKVDTPNAIYYAQDEWENPIYGKSMFLPAYNHFDKKHKLYYTTHLALAVGAVPPRVAKAKPTVSPADQTRFLDALGNLGTNAAMLLPEGFEIVKDALDQRHSGNLPFMEMIEHHNLQMSESVNASFVDAGAGGQSQGFSSKKGDIDLYTMTLEGIMEDIGDFFNDKVIPDLIYWNFKGSTNYPRIEFPALTNDARDMLQDIFSKVLGSRNPQLSPEFMAEMEKAISEELGLDVPDEAIDKASADRIMQQELEQAMERANQAVGQNVKTMSVMQMFKDPKFQKFAEGNYDNFKKMVLHARIAVGQEEV